MANNENSMDSPAKGNVNGKGGECHGDVVLENSMEGAAKGQMEGPAKGNVNGKGGECHGDVVLENSMEGAAKGQLEGPAKAPSQPFLAKLDKADAAFERLVVVRVTNRLLFFIGVGMILTSTAGAYYMITGKKPKAVERAEMVDKRLDQLEHRVAMVEHEQQVAKAEREQKVAKVEQPKKPVQAQSPLSPLHGFARNIMRRVTSKSN